MIHFCLICLITMLSPTNPTVYIYGALRNIMHQGSMVREVELGDLESHHLYALGAVENLKGEILILDGKPFIASEKEGEIAVDESYRHAATLLVSSYVEIWDSVLVEGELEQFIATAADNHGLNLDKPFPFLLKGNFKKIQWHVVNWPEGDELHTHEKHQTSGPHGILRAQSAIVLGFFSRHHQGIFTHHSTHLHMHMKCDEEGIVGHVDELEPDEEVWLFLPATN